MPVRDRVTVAMHTVGEVEEDPTSSQWRLEALSSHAPAKYREPKIGPYGHAANDYAAACSDAVRRYPFILEWTLARPQIPVVHCSYERAATCCVADGTVLLWVDEAV
jgi:hypothetical protein